MGYFQDKSQSKGKVNYGANQGLNSYSSKPDAVLARFKQFQEMRQQRVIAENIQGEIPVGFVNNSDNVFGLRKTDAPKIVETIGQPGSGKTNLFRVLIDGVIKNTSATILMIDTKGTEKYLYNYIKEKLNESEYLFMRPEQYYENPLHRPHPDIPRESWYKMVCGYLLPSWGVRYESGNAMIAAAYKAKCSLPNDVDPSLPDLYSRLIALRPKNYTERIRGDYVERALYRIEMSIINLSKTLACRRGVPIEEYRKKRFILLDLSQVDEFSQTILIDIFIVKIYHYQLAINRDNEASWFILIDEASNVFSENKIETHTGISPRESTLRMSRSTGIWFDLASQSYSKLSHGARTMAGCKILFKTDPTELRYLKEAMNLSADEIDTIDSLKTGEALVKLESRPGTPVFKIYIPEFKLRSYSITDNEIFSDIRNRYDCLPMTEEERLKIINQILGEKDKPEESKQTMPEIKKQADMSDNKKITDFLVNIAEKAFLQFTERLTALKFGESIAEADRIKKLLIDHNYVNEYKVKLKKGRGSKASYLELSNDGKRYLAENGYNHKTRYEGKAGFLHSLIVHRLIKPFYDSKYRTDIEGKQKGADSDLAVYDGERKIIAVEVSYTTTSDDEIRNIKRDIDADYAKVQIVVVSTSNEGKSIVEDEAKAQAKKQAFIEVFNTIFPGDIKARIEVRTLKELRDLT